MFSLVVNAFLTVFSQLEIHTHIEETVFYPAIEEHEEFKDMVAEALEEHQEAKMPLEELEEGGPDSCEFGSMLQQSMEAVEHHIEEEEGEIFPKIREVFDEDELERFGISKGHGPS